ncbi:MAG: EF-hand domain-containing protein [Deltaproteobacteria bacterium]|nr:EF-hand domain-containing protein [Deltaproteobacteria bacterium]
MSISAIGSSGASYAVQTASTSRSGQSDMASQLADKMLEELDANGDGFLSAEEIGVDQEQLAQGDADSDGQLSNDELMNILQSMGPPPGAGQAGGMAKGGGPNASQMFDSLDTNEDGVVSQEEFLAGRPDDVSEEDATAMWSQLDSEGAGGLTEEQFSEAMSAMGPPPGPPPGGAPGSSSTDASASGSDQATATELDLSEILANLLANYGTSKYQETLSNNLASLSSTSQSTGGLNLTA